MAPFIVPEILEVPPISEQGNLVEIAGRFGGVQQLRDAVNELQSLVYAARRLTATQTGSAVASEKGAHARVRS